MEWGERERALELHERRQPIMVPSDRRGVSIVISVEERRSIEFPWQPEAVERTSGRMEIDSEERAALPNSIALGCWR